VIPRDARCGDDALVGIDSGAGVVRSAQTWAHDHLVPLNASLEVTLACNIRCLHCYNFDRDAAPALLPGGPAANTKAEATGSGTGSGCGTRGSGRPELTTEELLDLIDQLRQAGCLFLSLTGGEVLSHPGLFRLLDRARESHMAVQLLSNGTLLRPGMAARLGGYANLLGVSVSLYGATAEVHDAITQVTGSFRRTWAGVMRLRAVGVAVRLKFIVMRPNAHETEAMMTGASAQGFPFTLDLNVTARHDGTDGSLATRVTPAQLEGLSRGPLRPLLPRGRRPPPPEQDFNCNCARGNCAISATGDVYPCVSVPWAAGNVREQPFADIWRDSPVFRRIRGLRLEDYGKCGPCPHRGYCGHDRGAAFTATGDYTSADPFVCAGAELTHRLADEEEAPEDPGREPAPPPLTAPATAPSPSVPSAGG
jgi:radical SAM protein with 4Fe4S-binding SPASM domain